MLISYTRRTQTLGTLASVTALGIGANRTYAEKTRLASLDYWILVTGGTSGEMNSLLWGIAALPLTVAEVAEALIASPDSPRAVPEAEQANRRIRILGSFDNDIGAGQQVAKEGHVKVNMTFDEAGYFFFVYNRSGAALTNGSSAFLTTKEYAIQGF